MCKMENASTRWLSLRRLIFATVTNWPVSSMLEPSEMGPHSFTTKVATGSGINSRLSQILNAMLRHSRNCWGTRSGTRHVTFGGAELSSLSVTKCDSEVTLHWGRRGAYVAVRGRTGSYQIRTVNSSRAGPKSIYFTTESPKPGT